MSIENRVNITTALTENLICELNWGKLCIIVKLTPTPIKVMMSHFKNSNNVIAVG